MKDHIYPACAHAQARTTLTTLLLTAVLYACGGGDSGAPSIAFTDPESATDPVIQDFPVAFIRRPFFINDDGDTITSATTTMNVLEPGARLLVKSRAIPSAEEQTIAPLEDGLFDIRDLTVDSDGNRLAFAMRGPIDPDADLDDQPTWNIWIWNRTTEMVSRVIVSDTIAAAGNDRQPAFLPDGRIVFTSNRQRQARAILLDEGRPQYAALDEDRREEAFVLHVMDDDGSNIRQLSFNQSHDTHPVVETSGRIVFLRWDNVPGIDVLSYYSVNPDGTNLQREYGYHSENSGRDDTSITYSRISERDDGTWLTLARPGSGSFGGEPLVINAADYVDATQPTAAGNGAVGSGQSYLLEEPVLFNTPSPRGRFAALDVLNDGTDRLLVAWSQCRLSNAAGLILPCSLPNLTDEDLQEAPPLYSLWILDPQSDSQQPVITPTEDSTVSEGVVMARRSVPTFISPLILDETTQALADEATGALHIRSVYDVDGTDPFGLAQISDPTQTPIDERPVMYLRLVKAVSIPDREIVNLPGTAFGRSSLNLMREILGYGTVHPDGSVLMKVPADVPFTIELVDAAGKRVSTRHRHWLQVRAGEVKQCHGCHESGSTLPHGRDDAVPMSINPGLPFPGLRNDYQGFGGQSMAEGLAQELGVETPSFDLHLIDYWSEADNAVAASSIQYQSLETPGPISTSCATNWIASCRATIHYESHIHPLWGVNRQILDGAGDLLEDRTCQTCHNAADAAAMAQIPAGQLDLSDGPSPDQADHFRAYRELLFNDAEQELVNGALVDRLEPILDGNGNPTFLLDANGDQVLDAAGDPIPLTRTVNVAPSMNVAGALASPRFFSPFETGGTHQDYLTRAELKLIAEWLDVGGQYYNDPFQVPQ